MLLTCVVVYKRGLRFAADNLHLWRCIGLPLNRLGYADLGNAAEDSSVEQSDHSQLALYAITRILCLVATAMFPLTRAGSLSNTLSPDASGTGAIIAADVWVTIDQHLTAWYESRDLLVEPVEFPCSDSEGFHWSSDLVTKEVWYADNTAAIGMIYYHMAKILMALVQPPSMLTPSYSSLQVSQDWLSITRTLRASLKAHAQSIISIALGSTDIVSRASVIQPLYFAGRCLDREEDQRSLLGLLETIENTTGIATGYRIEQLVEEWETPHLFRRSQLDSELSDISSVD